MESDHCQVIVIDRVLHLYVKLLELQKIQTSNDIKQFTESLEKTVPVDFPSNMIALLKRLHLCDFVQ